MKEEVSQGKEWRVREGGAEERRTEGVGKGRGRGWRTEGRRKEGVGASG